MKNFRIPLILFLLLFVFNACQKEALNETTDAEATVEEVQETPLEVSKDVVDALKSQFFNAGEMEVIDFQLPDGTTEQRYRIEGDITFSVEQMESLKTLEKATSRNYHTNNLVSPRALSIIGYTGGQFALSSKERTALQWAVNNYNRLGLSIRFNLTFGTNFQNKDMVVYFNPNESGSGGSAGFPSGGDPNKFIQIYGLDGFTTNVNEHVITHEIGHSVGFRHTDWFSRQSCGQNVNEGAGSIGAIPIPGTPAGYDPTSIMLACFSSNSDGEFNGNDVTALNYLY